MNMAMSTTQELGLEFSMPFPHLAPQEYALSQNVTVTQKIRVHTGDDAQGLLRSETAN